jgi:hypothetical protein
MACHKAPIRVDDSSQAWFYEQHRALWTWVSELTPAQITRAIRRRPYDSPDYAIKRDWPGWGTRWGLERASFACEVGDPSTGCAKCPLGAGYCQREDSGYAKLLRAFRGGDIDMFRAAAIEIRDAWAKPPVRRRRGL